MKTTLRTLDICFFLILAMIAIFLFYQNGKANQRLSDQKKLIEKYFSQFQEDQKFADQLDFFKTTTRLKNAGEYLNSRIRWSNLEQSFEPEIKIPSDHDIEWHGESTQEFLDLAKELKKNPIDTTWMSRLLAYDHWDLYANSPQEKTFNAKVKQGPWEMPYPSVRYLRSEWATVRLLQGLNENNVEQAIREVQHAAKIFYSTEGLVLSMNGLAYLKALAVFVKELNIKTKNKILTEQEWSRLRRLIYARSSLMVYPWDSSEVNKMSGEFGFCSGLSERIVVAAYLKPIMGGRLSAYREITAQMMSEHPECVLTIPKKVWDDPIFEKFYDQIECDKSLGFHACTSLNQISKIPVYGFILAKNNLASLFYPEAWQGYENQENQK